MLKRTALGILLGVTGAGVTSVILAILSGFFAGYSHHVFEAVPWLLWVSLVPAALGGLVLSLPPNPTQSRRSHWLRAVAVAFAVAVLSGSAGAVAVGAFQRGISAVNVSGYLAWCWVYGLALLPLTAPVAHLGARVIWRQSS